MKQIYYWSPFFSNIATTKAVLNSILSIKKYSKSNYNPVLINVFGEWDFYIDIIKENKIDLINLGLDKHFEKKKINGFFLSRFYQLKIFFFGFLPLLKVLKKNKPDVLILHLVTSLPLFLNFLFKFQTKFVLRISGLPKLNVIRNLFWKIVLRKISVITTPTEATSIYLKKFFPDNDIYLLRDPIISVKDVLKKKTDVYFEKGNIYVSIGRLTKQKNFLFLLKAFKEIIDKNKNNYLYILGTGENFFQLKNFIKSNRLEKNIFLMGYENDVYKYLKSAKAFILASLWEDPGFVLIEAAFANTSIISSDCKNGPLEILNNGENGHIFQSNNINSFIKTFEKFNSLENKQKIIKKINAKKMSKNFSIFRHYSQLDKILNLIIFKKEPKF
tara:strand:- start:120 stop:1280 length:1161 start_codon:yes stop_codon:yes gene_type:complete